MDNSQIDVIVGKQAFEQVGKLDKDLQELYKSYLKLFELSQKMSKNPLAVKTTGEAKSRVKELSTNSERLNAVLKEQDRLEKALIRTLAQKELAEGATAKAVARAREEVRQKNLETKRAAIQSSQELGAYKKLSNTLNKLRQEYKDVATAQGVGSKEAKRLRSQVIALDSSLKKIDESAGQFGRSVGNYPKAFQGAAKGLRSLVGAFGFVGGIQLFASAVKNSFDRIRQFDKAMQNIAGIMRVSRKDISDLESEIVKVAGSSIKTSNEVAELAENLVTLGKTKEEIKDLLKPVNDLAIGLETTSAESAEFLVQMLNTFGASTDEADKYADVIATIRTSTSLDFQRMRDSFQYLAPISKVLNKDLAYTGSLIGILSDNGIKAERAGRLLGTAQMKLATEGKTLIDALEEINESVDSGASELDVLALSSKLMGKQAASLGAVLANNTDLIDKNAEAIRNNGGALEDLTNSQLESLDAKLKILDSTWESFLLGIESGEGAISDFFKSAIGGATELLKALDYLNKTQKEFNGDNREQGRKEGETIIDTTINSNMSDENKKIALDEYRLEATKELNKQLIRQSELNKIIAQTKKEVNDADREVSASTFGTLDDITSRIDKTSKQSQLGDYEDELEAVNKGLNTQLGILEQISDYGLEGVETESAVTDRQADKLAEKRGQDAKKLADQRLKDSYALNKYLLEQEIERNDEIINDENATFLERLEAANEFADKSIELADLTKEYELQDKTLTKDAKLLIDAKYEQQKADIAKKGAENISKITEKQELDYDEDIKKRLAAQEKLQNDEITALNNLLRDKEITQEQHEKRLLDIKKRYAIEGLQTQLDVIESLLSKETLSADVRIELEQKVAEIRRELSEFRIERAEETYKTLEFLQSEEFERSRAIADELVNLTNAVFDNRVQRIDDDINRNNDYYSTLLDNERLTEQQRDQLEAERDAKNALLEKKKREEQRKQAIFNKVIATTNIAINTAEAISEVSPNPVLIALAAALGAAQLATVIATPIPQYKTGKKKSDNYEGVALLNDGGRNEVRVDKYGNASLIEGRNVLSHVAKDDIIYPSVDAFNRDMNKSLMATNVIASRGAKEDDLKMVLNGFRSEMKQSVKEGFAKAKVVNHVHVNSFDRNAYIKSKMH